MDYSEDFKYDELKVFSQHGIKYCIPVWAYQTDLNVQVDTEGISIDTVDSFNSWAESKRFPLKCAFEIPDGVYSSFLFKVVENDEELFGINKSFYQYKGKNPMTAMNIPIEDCPFDEILPVPKQENDAHSELSMALKMECDNLKSMIEGHINEVGMRKLDSGRLQNMNLIFPKYLYN